MFQKATRLKLRFDTPKGLASVEDLWELPLTGDGANLDDIARALHRKLESSDQISFVVKDQKADTTDELKFEIVKHVIAVRLAEAEVANSARINKEKKQKLLALLAQKEDQAVQELSADEIRKMIEDL
jgi:hypothetical protein